jgi:NAD(P)-dependent dehydrogenase (short-subunit alcohol dehydrogenase family)
MGRLDGKVTLVTEGGNGFGEAIAKTFAREGANVLIADISVKGGERVVSEIVSTKSKETGHAVFIDFDCTKQQAWKHAVALAKQRFGKWDIVCNNGRFALCTFDFGCLGCWSFVMVSATHRLCLAASRFHATQLS